MFKYVVEIRALVRRRAMRTLGLLAIRSLCKTQEVCVLYFTGLIAFQLLGVTYLASVISKLSQLLKFFTFSCDVLGSCNCQKWKSRFFSFPCHKIIRYTPVHLVESVENCVLCMRRYLACSSYANVMHRELAITRALRYDASARD